MSDKQFFAHFKVTLPLNIDAQLLEIEERYEAIGKVKVLVLLSKSELPQSTSSPVLANMTERTGKQNNTFHETFSQSWIIPKWLTRGNPEKVQNTAIAKPGPQQQVGGSFANRRNMHYIGFEEVEYLSKPQIVEE